MPCLSFVLTVLASCIFVLTGPRLAVALETIVIKKDSNKAGVRQSGRIDLTRHGDFYAGNGRSLQVETAPDREGFTQRIVVRATARNIEPNWVVFALKNASKQHLERWLVADRYKILGSGLFWPDLDGRRILSVTPSLGFKPEKIPSDQSDIFRISLEPGATVTYVAELVPGRFPGLSVWTPAKFEQKRRNHTLFNGILLGVTGLIALFLSVLFVANHNSVFPAAALLAWSALVYLCVDFGFFDKLFNLDPDSNALYRAIAEAAFAASLLLFFFVFLRLRQWHLWLRYGFYVWIGVQLGLVGYAFVNPVVAAGLARLSIGVQAVVLSLFVLFLVFGKQKRALSLLPTWVHFLVWSFGGAVIIQGLLSGDLVSAAFDAGLVLFVALVGFLVIQFAFHQADATEAGLPGELKTRALALQGAGAYVWEWNDRRDRIRVSSEVEESLGLTWGTLNCRVQEFLEYLHPADRDRFRQVLFEVEESHGGSVNLDFRMRRTDGTYLWFDLDAHSDDLGGGRFVRCVGLLRDVTSEKRARERLMHDAVHDSLTGLPNRQLFLDRLYLAVQRTKNEDVNPPTVILVDIDRFKNVNTNLGLGIGDSLLLTVAERLRKNLGAQDTLARVGGDQFAIQIIAERDPRIIAGVAEDIRRLLRQPIEIGEKEIILTCSLGISIYDHTQRDSQDLYREAEIAMYRAKRQGTDRIEIFTPDMRSDRDESVALETDLRLAIERNQIVIFYQPIMELGRSELAGFEALIRWEHPVLGMINPDEFIPMAEESGIIYELGLYVLEQAGAQLAQWHQLTKGLKNKLFVSVNVSSRQLFEQDLFQDVRKILEKYNVPRNTLRLEITESLVMQNPARAVQILDRLKALGVRLSMDDFGTGYSSLAYLTRFPFDTLKVDREIVQITDDDNAAPAILRSVVALGHELQMNIVAEGIETESELRFLRHIGCDYGQGFYFGEPMVGEEVKSLLMALLKSGRLSVEPKKTDLFTTGLARLRKPEEKKAKETAVLVSQDAEGQAGEAAKESTRVDDEAGLVPQIEVVQT